METSISHLLLKITGQKDLHARWLNTLSFLEYVGFRKIVKSQHSMQIDSQILKHALEEGRHALILKKMAFQIGGTHYKNYSEQTLLCGQQAESYFQSLDRACASHFEMHPPDHSERLVYLYVTLLIELRALSVYDEYQSILKAHNIPLSLNGLLAEEQGHLSAVERELGEIDAGFPENLDKLRAVEENLFSKLTCALADEISRLEVETHAPN
jgi:hypothetical protein